MDYYFQDFLLKPGAHEAKHVAAKSRKKIKRLKAYLMSPYIAGMVIFGFLCAGTICFGVTIVASGDITGLICFVGIFLTLIPIKKLIKWINFFTTSTLKVYEAYVYHSYGPYQNGYYADLIIKSNGQYIERCPYYDHFMEAGTPAYVGFYVKRRPFKRNEYDCFPIAARKY